MEATARSHTGFAWFDIAVCLTILGDPLASAQAFALAAENMHASLEVMARPALATYAAAIEAAVLSGDPSLASHLVANAVEPEARPSLLSDRLA